MLMNPERICIWLPEMSVSVIPRDVDATILPDMSVQVMPVFPMASEFPFRSTSRTPVDVNIRYWVGVTFQPPPA